MTTMENQLGVESRLRPLALLADRASVLVQTLAQPWLVQLVMRVALAVPFWKSGMLKWDGFLQLNDTAVTLFTDEFKLHLPGGPYPFPAPTVMAFLSGSAEIIFPILLVLGFGTRFAARPLELDIPLMVTGMSFGALSKNAKTALARGPHKAGTSTTTGAGAPYQRCAPDLRQQEV